MLSYQNIKTIANYESKTLFRTWFFKIFSILSIVLLSLFHLVTNMDSGADAWPFHALPANVPYINIKFLNIVQSIIAVFLASGFLKKDKKLDTSVVIYVRPMSNAEYVFGKTLGVFKLFIGLNIASLAIAYIICTATSGSYTDIVPYLIYPAIISIPSLIYIFGLSFVTMTFIKNQSITFLLLLGYISVCVIYLGSKVNPLFDYTSYHFPLLYSDMVGFSNINDVLLHRGGYLLAGIGLILLTVVKLERLANSPKKIKIYYLLSILFILSGAYSITTIWINNDNNNKQLDEIAKISNTFYNVPTVDIKENNISIVHTSKIISCNTNLKIINNTKNILNKYILSLNPGLSITSIKLNNSNIKYKRSKNIIEIYDNISSGETKTITLQYSGTINENICYADIPKNKRNEKLGYFGLNIPKKYSFITSNYVLLTPESNWYPTAGLNYNPLKPAIGRYRFTKYNLTVKTDKDLLPISQGEVKKIKDGEYSFKTEHPLTQISLLIGEYERQEIKVDSITYSINIKKGHDYYTPVFKDIKDTIPSLLRTMLTDYEIKQKRKYPYKRITIVEAPAQFYTYERLWTNHSETVQPEMVIVPELGLTIPDSDFASRFKNTLKWRKRRDENVKENDIRAEIFSRNMYNMFLSDQSAASIDLEEDQFFGMTSFNDQIYSLYPNFYTFTNTIASTEYPIIGSIVENLTKDQTQSRKDRWVTNLGGVTKQELANLDLENTSLKEILNDTHKYEKTLADILHNKANYLKAIIISKVEKDQLREDLATFYNKHSYKTIDFKDFSAFLKKKYNICLDKHIHSWYNAQKTPGFIIHSIKGSKIEMNDEKKFQIRIKISNLEAIEGIVSFKIILRNRGGRKRGSFNKRMANALEYSYQLKGNTSYEIGIITNQKPVIIKTNTIVSKNIPSNMTQRFEKFEESKSDGFSGIKEINIKKEEQIIIDNEDDGFKLIQEINEKKLKQMLSSSKDDDESKYKQMISWRPPSKWTLFTKEGQYGKYIKSGYYARSGENNKKAIWTANIKKAGYYEVFFFYQSNTWNYRSRRTNKQNVSFKYNLNVISDDGVTNIDLNLDDDSDDGWLSLGSYYFSEGEAKVELNDKSTSRSIIADAVKWVRKE